MTTGLLVAGGGFQGLPMLHALRALGARVVVADYRENNPNRYQADFYEVVPPVAERDSFAKAIVEICREHRVDIVFSTTAHDAMAVAELAPTLRRSNIVVAVSSKELLTAWSDKVACLRDLEASGLPVLPIVDPDARHFEFPLIGKQRCGWGSRGMVVVRSPEELEQALEGDSRRRLFWQPMLASFVEWSIDLAIDESGQTSPLVMRERLRSTCGFAVVSRVRHKSPVSATAAATAKLIAARGACGIVNVQILVDTAARQWLSDVNLRPGTSSTAALGDGVNFAAFMLGRPIATRSSPDFLHIRTLRDSFLPIPFERSIAGIAIDLDDCLIDHKAWLDDKLTLLLADTAAFCGPEERAVFETQGRRLVDEGPWDRLIDVALQRSGLDAARAAALIARWRAAHPARVVVYPDAAAAVRRLRAAGIGIALVTDNPARGQRQKLERLPTELRPDAIVLTDELGEPKPSAVSYGVAAERLGLDPSLMVAVGDSPWRDAVSALAAGYAGAVVVPRCGATGNPNRARFERAYPDYATRTHWMDDLWSLPDTLISACRA